MANEEVLDLNKFIEKRKKKTFKVNFNDTEILLLHDAPFTDIDDNDEDQPLKEVLFEIFRTMTVPEDVDKWDEIENDPDVGQSTAMYIYEYIKEAVGDRNANAKKEPQDHKKKSK